MGVREIFREPNSSDSFSDGSSPSYTITYCIKVDRGSDSPIVFGKDFRIPQPGHGLSTTPYLKVSSRQFTRESGSQTVWKCRITYTKPDSEEKNKEQFEDPLKRPPKIYRRTVKVVKYVDRDVHGELIRNTAGQTFHGGIAVQTSHIQLVYEDNQADFTDEKELYDLVDSVNAGEFLKAKPNTLRVEDIDEKSEFEEKIDFKYVSRRIVLEHNPDEWQARPLQAGFNQIVDGQIERIQEGKPKRPSTSPMPLDKNGKLIPSLTLRTDPKAVIFGKPNGDAFETYRKRDFKKLKMRI